MNRAEEFNKHQAWWEKVNSDFCQTEHEREIARGAAASAWNKMFDLLKGTPA